MKTHPWVILLMETYKWGDPFSLLFFEKFSLISKLRYGLNAFFTSKRSNFDSLENLSAEEWLSLG